MTPPAAAKAAAATTTNRLKIVTKRLYRSLMRSSQVYTRGSKHERLEYLCLLHRSGWGDPSWDEFIRRQSIRESDKDSKESSLKSQSLTTTKSAEDVTLSDADSDNGTVTVVSSSDMIDEVMKPPSTNLRDKSFHKKVTVVRVPLTEDSEDAGVEYTVVQNMTDEDGDDEDDEIISIESPHKKIFNDLLREFIGNGDTQTIRQYVWPSQVDPALLQDMIRREFKKINGRSIENNNNNNTNTDWIKLRHQVGFEALRQLNTKLEWADQLLKRKDQQQQLRVNTTNLDLQGEVQQQLLEQELEQQVIQNQPLHVTALPFRPSTSYLRPGTFLVAHPCLTGYFRRSVICILDHQDSSSSLTAESAYSSSGGSSSTSRYLGTYGLVVARPIVGKKFGRYDDEIESKLSSSLWTLKDVLKSLPEVLLPAFGDLPVQRGGPVHMSLQMIYASRDSDNADHNSVVRKIGGNVVPMVVTDNDSNMNSDNNSVLGSSTNQKSDSVISRNEAAVLTSDDSDMVIKYQGDVAQAADAVAQGCMDRDQVTFYVGASSWTPGQLESEIERGCWLPCAAPPSLLLRKYSENYYTNKNGTIVNNDKNGSDLWTTMLAACHPGLAELFEYNDEDLDINWGKPCDL